MYMNQLKVCFVGVGSIANRHIHNLREICEKEGINLTIDAFRRSVRAAGGVDSVYTKMDAVPSDYDAVFITNPTEFHLETLRAFRDKGRNFFVEKPAVSLSQLEFAKSLQLKNNAVYYVACPLRYNPVIQFIRENINRDDVVSIRSISSSYLPDWRPGVDYRDNYSAHKDMGGGVSIDLIHEWDYLTYLFGWPEKVHSFIGKISDLEIDSDDYAVYIAKYTDKIAELHLDYYGRKTIREIQLFTKEETILGDIAGHHVTLMKSGKVIDFDRDKSAYHKKELLHFLGLIQKTEKPAEDDFIHGLKVLELTQGRI